MTDKEINTLIESHDISWTKDYIRKHSDIMKRLSDGDLENGEKILQEVDDIYFGVIKFLNNLCFSGKASYNMIVPF